MGVETKTPCERGMDIWGIIGSQASMAHGTKNFIGLILRLLIDL